MADLSEVYDLGCLGCCTASQITVSKVDFLPLFPRPSGNVSRPIIEVGLSVGYCSFNCNGKCDKKDLRTMGI